MRKHCARCGTEYNVERVNSHSSAIPDPWYCPNCENKKDVPTEAEAIALKAENARLRKTAEMAGRMEEALNKIQRRIDAGDIDEYSLKALSGIASDALLTDIQKAKGDEPCAGKS